MFSSIAAVVLGSSLVAAVPTYPTCHKSSKLVTANFDDITVIPDTVINPVPTPYNGLAYNAFTTAQVLDLGVNPEVEPHSGHQYIGSGTTSKLTKGEATISADYPGSKVQSYDLHSFYYGCTVNTLQGAVEVPVECYVDVTGFKGSKESGSAKEVCHKRLHYVPSTALGTAQMAKGSFDDAGCKDLTYVEVDYTFGGVGSLLDLLLVGLIDNYQYTLNSCQ